MAECSSSTLSCTGSVPDGGQQPIQRHVRLAAEARRAAPVVAAPHEPGQQAAHPDAEHHPTPVPPDRGQLPQRPVAERPGRRAVDVGQDVVGQRLGLAHRVLGGGRVRWPVRVVHVRDPGAVTDGEHPARLVAMVASVIARPARSTSTDLGHQRRGSHAAGPDDGAGRDGALPLALTDHGLVLAHLLDGHAGQHLVAALLQAPTRVVTHRPRHLRQDLVAQLHQVGADIGPAQLRVITLGTRCTNPRPRPPSRPREAAAADHEGELARFSSGPPPGRRAPGSRSSGCAG